MQTLSKEEVLAKKQILFDKIRKGRPRGIRGVLSITILQRLEQLCPGFLSTIDLFAGTSTGGILALSLAAGMTPAKVLELYEVKGKVVFADSWLDNIKDLGLLRGAQFDNKGLKQELTAQFGDRTLGDLDKHVIISFKTYIEK